MPALIQYPVREYKINVDIEDIPFFAYLDSFDPEGHKFREYKTGQMTREGGPRWTQTLVNQHMQLDVYSLLIETKDKWVDDECHLDWLVVRHKINRVEFDGNILESESNRLELTGEVHTFRRVITRTERERMRILIRTVAHEISNDYAAWLKTENSYIN